MGLSINGGYTASTAYRYISQANIGLSRTISRLSSGLRINSSADDASGLAVREFLRADIVTARQGGRNINDAISMVQTADGAAGVISDNLVRMKQLAVQASGGTYSDQQRNILQQEFSELAGQISQITDTTSFNGINLYQAGQTIEIALGDGQTIGIDTENIALGAADLTADPQAAQDVVDTAISQLSAYRGNLGASANRLESALSVLGVHAESLLAAESRISDADVAKEAAAMTANLIAISAAMAVQAQSNTISQVVLMLLG